MGYQCRSESGGDVQCPPDGSGFRLTATNPYSLTHRFSSGRQVFGSTPGDCGNIPQPAKDPGKSFDTRWINSLQMADHVELVSNPPIWCAMKLARGEKIVRSAPRSRMSFN